MSSAKANCKTVFLILPAFPSTIALTLIPNPASISLAFLLGLINAARPDFNALAPSDALIPPSFIAVRKKAKSSTLPPSCLITGPAFGIATVKSSIFTTVWFSTALRKLILFLRSSAETPNAFVNEIVVSNAFPCSTLPRTESFVACATCAVRSAPILPIAAASAAIFMVSSTLTPYFVKLCASN